MGSRGSTLSSAENPLTLQNLVFSIGVSPSLPRWSIFCLAPGVDGACLWFCRYFSAQRTPTLSPFPYLRRQKLSWKPRSCRGSRTMSLLQRFRRLGWTLVRRFGCVTGRSRRSPSSPWQHPGGASGTRYSPSIPFFCSLRGLTRDRWSIKPVYLRTRARFLLISPFLARA